MLLSGTTGWTLAAPGLPTVAVYGLTISSTGRVLYAATHGCAVWKLDLGPHRSSLTSIPHVRHNLLREALDLLHPLRPARDDKLQGDVLDSDVAIGSERLY